MPTIYYIIKRFLSRFQSIQKQLDKTKHRVEVERFMQATRSMPTEVLMSRLNSSTIKIETLSKSFEQWRKNVNLLLEAEKVRHELNQATFEEVRKLNEAITAELKIQAEKWH